METLGTRLRHARLQKGLSQEQLARACGVWQAAVARIENGERKNISGLLLIALAAALEVRPEWLMHREKPEPRWLLPEERRSREDALRRGLPDSGTRRLVIIGAIWLRDRLNIWLSRACLADFRSRPNRMRSKRT